jgi:hypothetical protein
MQEERVSYVDICDESCKMPVWVASQWGRAVVGALVYELG